MSESFLYLNRADVDRALADLDAVAVTAEAHKLHADGRTVLPPECYLSWTTPRGHPARSLAMAGRLVTASAPTGVKVINGSLGNVAAGLPRASGVTLLFDSETAQVTCMLEAARISSVRTAATSMLAFLEFGRAERAALSIVGAGVIGGAHLDLALGRLPELATVYVADADPLRADALVRDRAGQLASAGVACEVLPVREAVSRGDFVVTATTATEPYLEHAWLREDAVVSNVSLDDLEPRVYYDAQLLLVDDWNLVQLDEHRLLGRLYRAGEIGAPGEPANGARRSVDGELGQALRGDPAILDKRSGGGIVVLNPFGLAIEDIALAAAVEAVAREQGFGRWIER
jgi:ornithine cyclodeaminase/alanine dehydrogenase-like protein (mu-crystallin family)